MKKICKKLFCFILFFVFVINNISYISIGATSSINIEKINSNSSDLNIKVTSVNPIVTIQLYKRTSSTNYTLFYRSKPNSTEQTLNISHNKFFKNEKTIFKIIVTDNNNFSKEAEFTVDAIPSPSQSPKPTPTSTSPPASPTIKPTTNPNPNPSPQPSTPTPSKKKTIKVLFVGNSKTYVNDIPSKFKGLAKSAGYNVEITTATEGGKTLKYLASHKKSTITKKAYDYVILQEQTDTYAGKYSTFLSGAKTIKKLVKAKNPNVKIIVRQTWVQKNSSSNKKKTAYNNAKKVASSIGATLAFDGKAFDYSRSKYSKINLYKDNTHQSTSGAYLSACCIFKAVFQQSPVGLSYKGGLSSSKAKNLQKAANQY